MLGTVHESNQVTGYTNRDFYHLTGIKSVPVVAGGGDNACSAIGCGVVQDGSTFVSLGTSGVVYTHNSVLPSNAQEEYTPSAVQCQVSIILWCASGFRFVTEVVCK